MSNLQNANSGNPAMPGPGSSTPEDNGGKSSRRGPRKRILIPTALMLILAVAGYVYWDKNLRGYVSTDDAFVEADQTQISSKILGRIVQLNAEEGDTDSGVLEPGKTYTAIVFTVKKALDSQVGKPKETPTLKDILNVDKNLIATDLKDIAKRCDSAGIKVDPEKQNEYFDAYYIEFKTPE